MGRQKLTIDRLRKQTLPEGKKQDFIWDTEVPMLASRVTKGAKAFVFQSLYAGKYIRMTIGAINDWQIDEARSEARRLQTLIDQGIDPRQAKAEKLAEAEEREAEAHKGKTNFSDAWTEYLQELKTGISAKTKRPYSQRYITDHENLASRGGVEKARGKGQTVAGPLASLLDVHLRDLTTERIAAWLSLERQERPTNTAHAYRLLRAFIRWLNSTPKYKGIVSMDAVMDDNVKKIVPTGNAKEGDCLQREQLSAWFKAVRNLSNPIQAIYLQALLLTGARREEMASLRWDDVDFKWGSLLIKDKVEGERIIPLTPYLSRLLSALPRPKMHNGIPNPWVFSSTVSKSGRIQEPRIAHNRALTAAGIPHISLHGLRRSFATLAEWIEVPTGVVAQIMGHKPSALAEKHYRRRPLDLLRMWHTKIEEWILEQARIKPSTEPT